MKTQHNKQPIFQLLYCCRNYNYSRYRKGTPVHVASNFHVGRFQATFVSIEVQRAKPFFHSGACSGTPIVVPSSIRQPSKRKDRSQQTNDHVEKITKHSSNDSNNVQRQFRERRFWGLAPVPNNDQSCLSARQRLVTLQVVCASGSASLSEFVPVLRIAA